jgi:hypothetical protein
MNAARASASLPHMGIANSARHRVSSIPRKLTLTLPFSEFLLMGWHRCVPGAVRRRRRFATPPHDLRLSSDNSRKVAIAAQIPGVGQSSMVPFGDGVCRE